MNKIYIVAIILILLIGGAIFWMNANEAQAPVDETIVQTENDNTSGSLSNTPENDVVADPAPTVKTFTVLANPFSYTPSVLTVKKGDLVRINFKNENGQHDFVIDGLDVRTSIIKTGEEQTIEFTADKPGNFEFYCSVGEHKALGMVGTLKVE
ncbi:MAG: cupredoxin domain-containing protein [Candidatus Paceibacterota bacterium]